MESLVNSYHREEAFVLTVNAFLHKFADFIYLRRLVGAADNHIENEIYSVLSVSNSEIVDCCSLVCCNNALVHHFFKFVDVFIVNGNRVGVNNCLNTKFVENFTFNFVNNLVHLNWVSLVRNFRVHRSKNTSRTIVVYDKVVSAHDSLVGKHHSCDCVNGFTGRRSAEKQVDSVLGKIEAAVHNEN